MNKYRLDLWYAMTAEGKTKRRGSNMALVDEALKAYWQAVDNNRPAVEKADALVAVIKACNKWLKTKIGKKEKGKIGFIKTKNELFARRKAAVTNLAADAMQAFRWAISFVAGPAKGDLRSKFQYQSQRYKTFTVSGARSRTQLKQIDESYGNERDTWLQSGKTGNISGTFVHEIHDKYNKTVDGVGGYELEMGNVDTTDKRMRKQKEEFEKLMSKNVETLNGSDWVKIRQFAMDIGLDGHTQVSTQCKYLRAAERVVALLFTNGNGLLEDKDGNLVDTSTRFSVLYVMDQYGNLYADYDANVIALGGRYLNHTSILAGSGVVSAGNIKIVQGQITLLNNNSGHYKPDISQLRSCVELLNEDGVDLNQAVIKAVVNEHGQMREKTWDAGNFANFVMNFAPDSVV